ncbi:MAG: hypothetical protein V3U90_06680, partial [Dehalococcoidia bacterium]
MRRLLIAAVGLVIAALVFSACGGAEAEPTPTLAPTDAPTVIPTPTPIPAPAATPIVTAPTPDLLEGAFFREPPSRPVDVTYTTGEGETVTVVAFEGQVGLSVDPAIPAASLSQLVQRNGGGIIAQIPTVGLYWAEVSPGTEAAFIDALRPWVVDAHPSLVIVPQGAPVLQIDGTTPKPFSTTTGRIQLDFHNSPLCLRNCKTPDAIYATLPTAPFAPFGETHDVSRAADHGDIVQYYRLGRTVGDTEDNVSINLSRGNAASNAVVFGNLLAAIESTRDLPQPTVVNMSLGPKGTGSQFGNEVANLVFYDKLLGTLEKAGAPADKTLIIQAVGNQKTD